MNIKNYFLNRKLIEVVNAKSQDDNIISLIALFLLSLASLFPNPLLLQSNPEVKKQCIEEVTIDIIFTDPCDPFYRVFDISLKVMVVLFIYFCMRAVLDFARTTYFYMQENAIESHNRKMKKVIISLKTAHKLRQNNPQ